MNSTASIPSIKALNIFTKEIGVSPATVWRWRQQGLLEVSNINGKPYVTSDQAAKFVSRVTSGEFAKAKPVPAPPRATASVE